MTFGWVSICWRYAVEREAISILYHCAVVSLALGKMTSHTIPSGIWEPVFRAVSFYLSHTPYFSLIKCGHALCLMSTKYLLGGEK